jgi:hypothetical protein
MTSRAPVRITALLATLAMLLAACQPSASPSPSAHESHEASHGPSEAPSEAPASEPGSATCEPPVVCDGAMPAGAYVSETTGARIEFSVDDHGWFGLVDTEGEGFGLYLGDLDIGHGIYAVAYAGEYFTDACDPNAGTTKGGAAPADFIAMIAARDGVTATEPVEVTIGGQPGLQVDYTTALPADCSDQPPWIWLWPLPVHGDFHFGDQERGQVTSIDAGSATVNVIVEAWPDVGDEDWEHLIEHAAEVIETMTITPL